MQGNSSLPSGNLDKHFEDGVLFVTYSLLISGSAKGASGATKIEGSAPDVTLRKGTRLYQIVQWLKSGAGDPLIVRLLYRMPLCCDYCSGCHSASSSGTSGYVSSVCKPLI